MYKTFAFLSVFLVKQQGPEGTDCDPLIGGPRAEDITSLERTFVFEFNTHTTAAASPALPSPPPMPPRTEVNLHLHVLTIIMSRPRLHRVKPCTPHRNMIVRIVSDLVKCVSTRTVLGRVPRYSEWRSATAASWWGAVGLVNMSQQGISGEAVVLTVECLNV